MSGITHSCLLLLGFSFVIGIFPIGLLFHCCGFPFSFGWNVTHECSSLACDFKFHPLSDEPTHPTISNGHPIQHDHLVTWQYPGHSPSNHPSAIHGRPVLSASVALCISEDIHVDHIKSFNLVLSFLGCCKKNKSTWIRRLA